MNFWINYEKYKMLYCNRIDVSEGIDANKTSKSKVYHISHYWYFLNEGFNFQIYVCNRCHDLLMVSINLNNIYISIKNADCYCIISGIGKSETIKIIAKY